MPSRWLVGAGPGAGVLTLPEGTGLRMRAGHKTILQMHDSRLRGTFPDRTKIDMKLASSVRDEARIDNLANDGLLLLPGQKQTDQSSEIRVPESVMLWGL